MDIHAPMADSLTVLWLNLRLADPIHGQLILVLEISSPFYIYIFFVWTDAAELYIVGENTQCIQAGYPPSHVFYSPHQVATRGQGVSRLVCGSTHAMAILGRPGEIRGGWHCFEWFNFNLIHTSTFLMQSDNNSYYAN